MKITENKSKIQDSQTENSDIAQENNNINESPNNAYEMALFKKRIYYQATIFAFKIVIPVIIIAVILLQFISL